MAAINDSTVEQTTAAHQTEVVTSVRAEMIQGSKVEGKAGAMVATPVHLSASLSGRVGGLAGLTAVAAAVAACGGGGGGPPVTATAVPGAGTTPTAGVTAVPSTPASSALTDAEAARFLQQAQFSSTQAEIAEVQKLGVEGWLDQQLNMTVSTTGWDWLMAGGYNTEEFKFKGFVLDFMMWHQLFNSADTLRKRVALALSELFVVSQSGLGLDMRGFAIAAYWDLLNQHAFGTYRQLLEAVTLSPAMGSYLNTKGNRRANSKTGRRPDENYAREVLQLFSIGLVELNVDGSEKTDASGNAIETYNQETVLNLARVFTGWNLDRRSGDTPDSPFHVAKPMILDESRHSPEEKRFFNVTVPAGTAGKPSLTAAMDAIANHANVAPFICKQLIKRLITSNPSPAYVQRVATVFNNDGNGQRGNLKAVVHAIYTDAEVRQDPASASDYAGKVREPMLRMVQWYHTFSTGKSETGRWQIPSTNGDYRLGQSPFRSSSVFNFFSPDYAPKGGRFDADNLVAPELQITDEASVAGYARYMYEVVRKGLRLQDYANKYTGTTFDVLPDYTTELALADTPDALLAHLNTVLCAGQMSAATESEIIRGVHLITEKQNKADWKIERVYFAVLCTMLSPDYLVLK